MPNSPFFAASCAVCPGLETSCTISEAVSPGSPANLGEARSASHMTQEFVANQQPENTNDTRPPCGKDLQITYATWRFKVNHIRRMSMTAPANRMRRRQLLWQRRRFQSCAAYVLDFGEILQLTPILNSILVEVIENLYSHKSTEMML